MRRLFILRPEPGASASVERAKALGLDAVALPLFEIEPVEWQSPEAGSYDALLLTSANALLSGGEGLETLRGLPAYAVGEATAEAARESRFDIAGTGNAGVDRLLASIEPGVRLLHLAGEDRHSPRDARQAIAVVTVYRAVEIPRPDGIDDIAGQTAAVHSPRAAARLSQLLGDEVKSTVRLACISEAAAAAAGKAWKANAIADKPTDEALLALAARLCEKRREQ